MKAPFNAVVIAERSECPQAAFKDAVESAKRRVAFGGLIAFFKACQR